LKNGEEEARFSQLSARLVFFFAAGRERAALDAPPGLVLEGFARTIPFELFFADFFAPLVFLDGLKRGHDVGSLTDATFDFTAFTAPVAAFTVEEETNVLPFAARLPIIAPATPPTTAPTGPATMPPIMAPVTPPAVCFETGTFGFAPGVCLLLAMVLKLAF
jgi:hypothetical protein